MKSKWQNRFYHLSILCAIVFVLNGCATINPSALNTNITAIDLSKESIALLTVKVANEYKTSFQPNITAIFVGSDVEKDGEKFTFQIDGKYKEVEDSFNEYLISFQLPAGTYKLLRLHAYNGDNFFITGIFSIPIYSTFSIEPQKIIYLGHIEATLVERTDEKLLRAGPVLPLLDQAVVGASGGTFVIQIEDLYESDIKLFQQRYPYLAKYQVENLTLPQWSQPTKKDMQ